MIHLQYSIIKALFSGNKALNKIESIKRGQLFRGGRAGKGRVRAIPLGYRTLIWCLIFGVCLGVGSFIALYTSEYFSAIQTYDSWLGSLCYWVSPICLEDVESMLQFWNQVLTLAIWLAFPCLLDSVTAEASSTCSQLKWKKWRNSRSL